MRKLLGWADKEELLSWPKKSWVFWQEEWNEKRHANCTSQPDMSEQAFQSGTATESSSHVASLYNENTGHNEIKKIRNERALERAFTDAASLGDQAFFLCADLNKTEAVSIDEALMNMDRRWDKIYDRR